MLTHRSFACFAAFGCIVFSAPAYAVFNVSSPGIDEGQWGLELRNRFDQDDRPSKDAFKMHALKADYGITKRWGLEMYGYWQDIPQQGYRFTGGEFENKFRFYEPGDYWLDFAVKLSYEWEKDSPDQVKSKFLLQKNIDEWSNAANVSVAKEVGESGTRDATLSLGWRTKYKLHPTFNPGFEYYNSFGEIVDAPDYNGQAHRIGPMFYGELFPGVSYQLGYLFGISRAAEDGSFKLFLRYEIPL